MVIETNKSFFHRYWEELWNKKNGEIIPQTGAEAITLHFRIAWD